MVLKLNARIPSDNQIAVLHAVKYLLTLQINDMILDGCDQACSDMPKDAIKL